VNTADNHAATPSLCWNCNAQLESPYCCDRCVKIQPWPDAADFFTFLGLPRRLRIDQAGLEERFLKLSRMFHPDFFQDSITPERDISLVNAARLNKAYCTLKDPTARAEYILELELGTRRKPSKTVPPNIAAQVMELQELLFAFAALSDDNPARIARKTELAERHAAIVQQDAETLADLDRLFAEYDLVMDEATSPFEPAARRKIESILTRIDQTLAARLYLKRIEDNVAAVLEGKDANPL